MAGRRGDAHGRRRSPGPGARDQYQTGTTSPGICRRGWMRQWPTPKPNAGAGTRWHAAGPAIADIQARLHDPEAADLALKTTKEDPHDPTIAAMTHFVRGRLAAEAGDAATGCDRNGGVRQAYADPAVSSNNPGYNCWIAPAEEAAGHPDKADAVLKTGGTFVDCYRFRADILDGRGDWTGAQKAYAEAVALAPDLPAAYYSWGVALAKHGDLAGAEAKLKDANQRGPHWADPLKAWGDVLVKQGKPKEALAKYDEALKYAPNWKAAQGSSRGVGEANALNLAFANRTFADDGNGSVTPSHGTAVPRRSPLESTRFALRSFDRRLIRLELPTPTSTTVRGGSLNPDMPLKSTSGTLRIHSSTSARK